MAEIYAVHLGLLAQGEIPSTFDEVRDDWGSTLKSKRSKIIQNLQRVIPDESAYTAKIKDRSNEEYAEFIRSDHPKYDEIMLKREIKMDLAKSRYITNRDNAFVEGGNFETGVTNAKDKFRSNTVVTWMVTGDRDKIYGLVPKAKYVLLGKKALAEELFTSADHLITSTDLKPFFKHRRTVPAVVATINKWMTMVAYAVLAGWSDSDIDTKIASKGNAELADYVNDALVNPDLDYTACTISIEKDATTGRWGIKIVEATPS
ncbi:MAG: hypothetical protein J7J61_09605 [Candidatus Hydrothermae bacterium]|nr:hypothetical protein [Candidatus Hydrothermae bacterium]